MSQWTFTSESVTEGHPDKLADQISDSILDAILAQDPVARVACETMVTTGLAIVAGEITTSAYVEIPSIVRETIKGIGYDRESVGFDGNTCGVMTSIDPQSPDIAQGVDKAYEQRTEVTEEELDSQGAGDQGMMFGYACDETDDLMPLPIWLAHRLAHRLAEVRKAGILPYLRPDGKTQVTVDYVDGVPTSLKTVLISTQHQPGLDAETLIKPDLIEHVIRPLVPPQFQDDDFRVLVNPTGSFELGGPHADCGLTGRKIIVDTYGGAARHGGGAFSGKDPSKVDRSAAYAARWVAKNVVAAGAAKRCEVQVAYAIGVARPVSVLVETFGTETVDPAKIASAVDSIFDLRPAAIIRDLDLRRPIYKKTAAYGHFGRDDKELTWESTPRVDDLKSGPRVLSLSSSGSVRAGAFWPRLFAFSSSWVGVLCARPGAGPVASGADLPPPGLDAPTAVGILGATRPRPRFLARALWWGWLRGGCATRALAAPWAAARTLGTPRPSRPGAVLAAAVSTPLTQPQDRPSLAYAPVRARRLAAAVSPNSRQNAPQRCPTRPSCPTFRRRL